jgi:hypothetical protein
MKIGKLHSASRQGIEVRRPDGPAAVAAKVAVAQVIGQYQDNVGLTFLLVSATRNYAAGSHGSCSKTHPF